MKLLAPIVVLSLLLAGCTRDADPALDCDPETIEFDGAFDATAQFIMPDGAPRYRVPGTDDHVESACWLQNALDVDGWSVHTQSFTGADYQTLEHGAMASYTQPGQGECSTAEHARVAGLQFHNLVATLDGPGDDALMIAAHWDSKRHANQDGNADHRDDPVLGANDGASGIGVLLALQRQIGPMELPFDVHIAFFDGEDGFEDCHAAAGSVYYARTMDAGAIDAMVLLDMVGDPEARFPRESRNDNALEAAFWDLAQGRGMEQFTNLSRKVLDDHVPFDEEGVPVVDIIDFARSGSNSKYGFPWYWHTSEDTLDKLDADFMADMQQLVYDALTGNAMAQLLQ